MGKITKLISAILAMLMLAAAVPTAALASDANVDYCYFDTAGGLHVRLSNAAGATLMLCTYDENGALESYDMYEIDENGIVDIDNYENLVGSDVKAFLWSDTDQAMPLTEVALPTYAGLTPNSLTKNRVEQNPYMPDAESLIHNDIYSSDVTNKCMPLGIYTEVVETTTDISPNSPPAFYYDLHGNALAPYSLIVGDTTVSGGIAILDIDSDPIGIEGSFLPALDDTSAYGIQISYSFVDADNNFVGPATNGHVVMFRTYDESGNVLEKFEKVLDVDVTSPAQEQLGDDIDTNILSITYDYSGNLWFVTGGFHKNPEYSNNGFAGYLDRGYIDAVLNGDDSLSVNDYLHFYEFTSKGENCENAIASNIYGCVILTNLNCYTFSASDDGVQEVWSISYDTVGGKKPIEGSEITGCGLAWGGGSSPTLTDELVLFTDNQDTVNLIAVDAETGKEVTRTPVLDIDGIVVSVENSICVYSADDTRASVLVCNWFGAGNAKLFEAGSDSSVQSYDNLYDDNWRTYGNKYLMPGVERVDVVKNASGNYYCETVWTRADLADTSMMKLSTGAGYYYGYTQNLESGEWGFIALDFDTGETVLWQPVSDELQYNNIAVGIMQGDNGNSVYCPTNSQTLLRISDRFAYLVNRPDDKLDLTLMERLIYSGDNAATYVLSVTVSDAQSDDILAIRTNGLSGVKGGLTLYYADINGEFVKADDFTLTAEDGTEIFDNEVLDENTIYEIRVSAADGGTMDINPEVGTAKVSVVLVYDAE